jgi:hypothetical protein
MGLFDNLQVTRNEKIDLIRMAISNYTSPYKISGSDAVTLNNLTEFVSDNIIFKKRQDYTENDLSNMMYKYAYRYFTQFVNPVETVNLMEMMIMYNKYMVFNIGENSLLNVFNISEKFTYRVDLIDDTNNVNQNSNRTYGFSIPYVNKDYRENYVKTFKLNNISFDVNGKILNLDVNGKDLTITTDFELLINDNISEPIPEPIEYDLTYNNTKVASIKLVQITEDDRSRSYTIEDGYASNIINNFESDINRFIDNMYISNSTRDALVDAELITGTNEDVINANAEEKLSVRKAELRNLFEEMKTNNILRTVVLKHIAKYVQNDTYNYTNSVTGVNIDISEFTQDAVKQINEQIKFIGMESDELHIIFKNSANSYAADDFPSSDISTFEEFLDKMFK